jgi:hypothetical protein
MLNLFEYRKSKSNLEHSYLVNFRDTNTKMSVRVILRNEKLYRELI